MLSVEQFAVLRAKMEAGRARDDVLREAGLSKEAWVQLQRHWLGELARASTQRSSDLAARYQAAFAGGSGGSGGLGVASSAASSSAAPSAPSSTGAASPAAAPAPEVVVAPVPAVPSYLRAAAFTPVSPMAPVPLHVLGASSGAPPAVVIQAPPAHAAVPSHAAAVVPSHMHAPALVSAPPLAAPAPVARVPLAQRGTMPLAPSPTTGAAPPSATPFVEGTAPSTAKRAIESSREPPHPTGDRRAALTGTALVSEERPRPAFTGTALASGPEGAELPFGARARPSIALPEGVPAMSLEQYAWLSATLKAAPPAELPAVLAKVRLTSETRKSLDEHWRARFDAEPALRQAFMPLFARFVAQGRV